MKIRNFRAVLFWGLLWMIFYLYCYEILWAVANRPTPGGLQPYDYRTSIEHPSVTMQTVLWLLSFPTARLLYRWIPDEPFTKDLVYFPLGVAFQWFGYGCLFGWWRVKRALRKANGI